MLLPIFLFDNREVRHQTHSENYKGLHLYELFPLFKNISKGRIFILLVKIPSCIKWYHCCFDCKYPHKRQFDGVCIVTVHITMRLTVLSTIIYSTKTGEIVDARCKTRSA